MSFFKSKSAPGNDGRARHDYNGAATKLTKAEWADLAKRRHGTYVFVYRGIGTPGMAETATYDQAIEVHRGCVAVKLPTGDHAVTPHSGRRVFVTGPDYCVQPEDHSDPLLIGAAALHAVLSPAEYAAIVQAPVAAAALEA